MVWDILIAGAGPAGAACAAFCARAGLRVLVIEREAFPREKVCGDCLNPLCWPVLDRLEITEELLSLPHSKLRAVEIATLDGTYFRYPITDGGEMKRGEIAIKRSLLDTVLARRAAALGAEIRYGHPIAAVEPVKPGIIGGGTETLWRVRAGNQTFTARRLVAADGRNSTVARLLGILPALSRGRVAIQTHLPAPAGFGEKALLRLLPGGYCGIASAGEGRINLCLVGDPASPGGIPALRQWAKAEFGLDEKTLWRTIAPLSRAPLAPVGATGLVLIGDAARVIEPFTGEGIYYALASGELAADYLTGSSSAAEFLSAYRRLYSGRLWINRLAKLAVLHPQTASALLRAVHGWSDSPALLRFLTAKVVG